MVTTQEFTFPSSDGVHLNREGAAKIAAYVTNVLLMGG